MDPIEVYAQAGSSPCTEDCKRDAVLDIVHERGEENLCEQHAGAWLAQWFKRAVQKGHATAELHPT